MFTLEQFTFVLELVHSLSGVVYNIDFNKKNFWFLSHLIQIHFLHALSGALYKYNLMGLLT